MAGSYGGVAFMIVAVLFTLVLMGLVGWPSTAILWYRTTHVAMSPAIRGAVAACFAAAAALSLGAWWLGMRSGVRALDEMG